MDVQKIRAALEEAHRELARHDEDYHHRTSIEVKNQITAALVELDAAPGLLDISRERIARTIALKVTGEASG